MPGSVYTWRQAVDGGGFQNAFAISNNATHTSYPGLAISGGDVAGFHRTTSRDGNCIWATCYPGITDMNHNCVNAIEFSQQTDGKVFALTARGGTQGLLISSDGGTSWKPSSFNIGGDGTSRGMVATREVGRHICVDNNGTHLWVAGKHDYAGGAKWGIAHSSDEGATFTGGAGFAMGAGGIPESSTVRFIVQDLDNDTILYVGVDGKRTSGNWSVTDNAGGLYKITNAKTNSPTVTKIAGPGVAALSTKNWMRDGIIIKEGTASFLYFIAGKKSGSGEVGTFSEVSVFKYNLASGTITDLDISAEGLRTDSQWTTMDGYRAGSNTVIWIGCWQGEQPHDGCGVAVTRNSGATWDKLTGATYPDVTDIMPSGRKFWLFEENQSFAFNKLTYDCSYIRVDPNNHNIVFSAGRGGVVRTNDNGASWRPAMEALAVSMGQASAYNPLNKNQWVEGNIDWAGLATTDRFMYTTMPRTKYAKGGGQSTAYAIHWTPRGVAIAAGGRSSAGDTSNGMVMTSPNMFTPLPSTTPAEDGMTNQLWQTGVAADRRPRVVGIADGKDGAGKHVLIAIAQIANGTGDTASAGIWRKVITSAPAGGSWTKVHPSAFNSNAIKNSLQITSYWPEGSPYIYTYERSNGKLWRSTDYGVSWTNIWTNSTTNSATWAGFMAGATESILYVSTPSKVYKITNADTTPVATALTIAGLTNPGPIAVDDDGWVYVTQRFNKSAPSGLWRSSNGGSTWENLTTNEFKQKMVFPHNMLVMTEVTKKTIFVDTWGNGTFIGELDVIPPTYPKYAEDFENGGVPAAAGAAIVAGNSNFSTVTGAPTFSATSKEGDRSGLFSVGATAGASYGESEALEPLPEYALDFYFQVTDLPSVATRIVGLLDGAGTAFAGLQLTTAGKIVLQDGATARYTSTVSCAVGQWYRVAALWDATANVAQIKIWSGANLLSLVPTETSSQVTYTNNSNVEKVRIGLLTTSLTNSAVLFDDIMTRDDGGWPDRGSFDPNHTIFLGFIPMGI